ncbi:LacI family DNA-binding transcriptional regulator [Streptomyces sp. ZAF1911]|uniref:LacI family DNA-binding transcriptional regulator n=1 Tax=Streptomyces sp. ZAF1911 TaxID=2944129 RepID=UPI00237AB2B0|nr:LacI family DNA-binding transcriptional regulator [Streptomyces sp. ZAF1911]MDD9375905.1 LacI family DNA-binding transcriptional regulator [Streptomyces sp. ZAF1911]
MNRSQRHPVTLADVAAEAGVSLATASRALHPGARRVREDLKAKVLDTARRLNYSTNVQAQAVASGTSKEIGLLVHDIADPYFSTIAAGVMRAADANGLLVTLGNTARSPEREIDHFAALRSRRCRAVILAGSRIAGTKLNNALRAEVDAFRATGGRVVSIGQHRLPVDTVVLENRAGARQLAQALGELGHRRFGVVGGPPDLLTARDRLQGFREGLAHIPGASLEAVVHGDFTRDGGHASMGRLLAQDLALDCVFAATDIMAVGAMAKCRELGIAVPDDLAFAGFDDISTLRDVTPALTTVRLPLEHIGETAVDLVVTTEPDAAPRLRRVKGEVVVRASTPPRERR